MYVDKSQRNYVNIIGLMAGIELNSWSWSVHSIFYIHFNIQMSITSENHHIPLFLPLLHCILYDYILDLALPIRSGSVLRDISICGQNVSSIYKRKHFKTVLTF